MSVEPFSAEQRQFTAVRFMVDAHASPCLLPRLLQPFARRDVMPDRMWSYRTADKVHVEIAVHALPTEMLHVVEGNLRQVVGVRSVTQERPAALLQVA